LVEQHSRRCGERWLKKKKEETKRKRRKEGQWVALLFSL
jgi:hypothetical protein